MSVISVISLLRRLSGIHGLPPKPYNQWCALLMLLHRRIHSAGFILRWWIYLEHHRILMETVRLFYSCLIFGIQTTRTGTLLAFSIQRIKISAYSETQDSVDSQFGVTKRTCCMWIHSRLIRIVKWRIMSLHMSSYILSTGDMIRVKRLGLMKGVRDTHLFSAAIQCRNMSRHLKKRLLFHL